MGVQTEADLAGFTRISIGENHPAWVATAQLTQERADGGTAARSRRKAGRRPPEG